VIVLGLTWAAAMLLLAQRAAAASDSAFDPPVGPADSKPQAPAPTPANPEKPKAVINVGTPAQVQPVPVAPPHAAPAGPKPTVVLKPGEEPKVEFDTPIYDIGRIRAGQDIVHDFWFHNNGTGPLEIVQVRPSCGCTTTGSYDRIVEPGQSGKIPIRVTTGQASGPISKTITISTNAPGPGSQVVLQVKGELWLPIQATPNMASFGNVSTSQIQDATLERKLTIVNNTDQTADLTEVKCTTPEFTADLTALEPGKKWELTVKMNKLTTAGVKSASITMNTGLKDMPTLQVPVNAYLLADVDVVPKTISLPQTRTGVLHRDIYVRNNSKNPVKVEATETSNEGLKVTLTETQPGMAFNVKLEVAENYKPTAGGDKVTIKTNHAGFPKIEVPIVMSNYPAPSPITTVTPKPAAAVPTPSAAAATAQKPVKPGAP